MRTRQPLPSSKVRTPNDARTDHELIRLAQGGDVAARNVLIQRHYGFIWNWTAKGTGRHSPYPVDDYIADGIQAFIRSIEGFDPKKTGSLLTYAADAIMRKVYKASRENTLIRCPENSKATVPNWEQHRERATGAASLDSTYADGAKRFDPATPADDPERRERSERIAIALNSLDKREREILIARSQGLILKDIGEAVGICKERVRQIEVQAMERMRGMLASVV